MVVPSRMHDLLQLFPMAAQFHLNLYTTRAQAFHVARGTFRNTWSARGLHEIQYSEWRMKNEVVHVQLRVQLYCVFL